MSRRSPGEGSITQRKDKRWQASLQVNGQRRTVYGKTRTEAAAKLRQLQLNAPLCAIQPAWGKQTLDELLDAWLQIRIPHLKPSTADSYRQTCDRYLRSELGATPIARITPNRIERLYSQYLAEDKSRTALKLHQVLTQALETATRWGWLAANPCERVKAPHYRPKQKAIWTGEQVRAFLDGTREHWLKPLWTLLAHTGCRLGEALALRWSDVDLVSGKISVSKSVQRLARGWVETTPKTAAGFRTLSLPQEAIAALRGHAERRLAEGGGELIFSNAKCMPLHGTTIAHAMQRECDRLGMPRLSPHGLRHVHASLLIEQGVPITRVSATPTAPLQCRSTHMPLAKMTAKQLRRSNAPLQESSVPLSIMNPRRFPTRV